MLMKRKNFLSLLPAALLLNPLKSKASPVTEEALKIKKPPYLVQGDKIGITCPAGFITLEEVKPAVIQLESWGYQVVIGQTVGAKDFTFGGTDQERLTDMQQLLDDVEIKAIMCARGGYGAVRILDFLDFSTFKASPKWIIGFSDITILHSHLNSVCGVASIHAKMCNSFPSDWSLAEPIQISTINSIASALKGETMQYNASYHPNNKLGAATAELIGGNLRCLENLAGSKSALKSDGKILFLEDTGEYLYSIDRMFYNLKRSGKLDNLKGLVIGGFKIKPDDVGQEFGKTLMDIVLEKVKEFNYPVCFDFPVGHQRANFALKCGIKHRLEVTEKGTFLREA